MQKFRKKGVKTKRNTTTEYKKEEQVEGKKEGKGKIERKKSL